MLALTIWQPMAWAISAGHKRIENRTWVRPHLVDPQLAIHAGKEWHAPHAEQMRELLGIDVPPRAHAQHGAVIAVARVAGFVHKDSKQKNAAKYIADPFFSGPYGWVLTDVVALPKPVLCKGRQGLWTLPVGAQAEVVAQLS